MYYVTEYRNYPIYEPAEGGYYYSGVEIMSSREFKTFRKARQFINRVYKDTLKNEMDYVTGASQKFWATRDNQQFGANGKYIGDGWMYKLERKQGSEVCGWEPYC